MTTVLQPPRPRGKPVLGNLLSFRRDPLGFLSALAREYGDIVRLKFGRQDVYLLNHPDYIRDVLVTHNTNFIKSRGLYAGQMPPPEKHVRVANVYHGCARLGIRPRRTTDQLH
ncbi:MAG TPA: cytochrome P450 [Blastocatellia bacterium]|nr:cytochrome P450 [Blastocatellia bacterium]